VRLSRTERIRAISRWRSVAATDAARGGRAPGGGAAVAGNDPDTARGSIVRETAKAVLILFMIVLVLGPVGREALRIDLRCATTPTRALDPG